MRVFKRAFKRVVKRGDKYAGKRAAKRTVKRWLNPAGKNGIEHDVSFVVKHDVKLIIDRLT
jgi:hypothetical protein